MLGHYSSTVHDSVARGELHPLRSPSEKSKSVHYSIAPQTPNSSGRINKLFKDCFRFTQVEVVDAFVESGAHSIQDAFGIIHFIEFSPKFSQARGGSKFKHCCMLILRDL